MEKTWSQRRHPKISNRSGISLNDLMDLWSPSYYPGIPVCRSQEVWGSDPKWLGGWSMGQKSWRNLNKEDLKLWFLDLNNTLKPRFRGTFLAFLTVLVWSGHTYLIPSKEPPKSKQKWSIINIESFNCVCFLAAQMFKCAPGNLGAKFDACVKFFVERGSVPICFVFQMDQLKLLVDGEKNAWTRRTGRKNVVFELILDGVSIPFDEFGWILHEFPYLCIIFGWDIFFPGRPKVLPWCRGQSIAQDAMWPLSISNEGLWFKWCKCENKERDMKQLVWLSSHLRAFVFLLVFFSSPGDSRKHRSFLYQLWVVGTHVMCALKMKR